MGVLEPEVDGAVQVALDLAKVVLLLSKSGELETQYKAEVDKTSTSGNCIGTIPIMCNLFLTCATLILST